MQIHTPGGQVADGEFPVSHTPGTSFAVITLDPQSRTRLFMDTRSDCERLMRAVARAWDMLPEETAEPADHPFVSPGLVAPDRPAPDACMTCGQPRAAHPDGTPGPVRLCSGQLPHQSHLGTFWRCTLDADHAGPHEAGGSAQIGEPNITWPQVTAGEDADRAIVADLDGQTGEQS